MYKITFLFCALIITSSLFLTSCEEDNDLEIELKLSYFPLQEGNYWQFDSLLMKTIDKKENLDGKNYSPMITIFVSGWDPVVDTTFYRISPNGKVYSRRRRTNELLAFDLAANVGDIWTHKINNLKYTRNIELVSKSDTVELGGGHTFTNCYRFVSSLPQLSDHRRSIWLAPGVGFVKVQWHGGPNYELKLEKVGIDSVETQY